MSNVVLTKSYEQPKFCKKEIMRYAGCKQSDNEVEELLDLCIKEVSNRLTYKVCYTVLDVNITDSFCNFGLFRMQSKSLAVNLSDCSKAVLFAATVGIELDRLIARYGRISPSKALMFQAIGAERIEALCDIICNDIEKEYRVNLKPRFSPGYADLLLETQKDIFAVLDCPKRIGLSLNDSLLMSPSKSVTAFAGICDSIKKQTINKCSVCDKKDCNFRGSI